jgi:glycine/D-amino acid oxidase-like deaminating enzyme/nitrite reductase/ring-hydroxylating ferredoxin subunit
MRIPARPRSLWIATAPGRPFPRLREDVEVDVAIIGGGITGLTAALLLKRAGRTVAVLESRRVAEQVTGGTTAHLTEALDADAGTLIRDFGEDGARRAYESSRAALEQIASIVAEEKLDAGFHRVPAWWWTETAKGVPALEAEHEALRRLGVRATVVKKPPLGFPAKAGLRFDEQARFHVRDYLLPLARRIAKAGSHVYEQTRVLDIEDAEPCRVVCETGVVTAQQVIVATHVPIGAFWVQPKLAQYRSYVIAGPYEGKVADALLWDDADPYHYVRLQETAKGRMLVVGGEDHKVGQEADTLGCYQRLLDWTLERFRLRAVAYRWSRQVVETVDGLPYIGRPGRSERVFVGTGYSGTGMTFGTLAAMMATDAVLGRENPWSSLYRYNRVKAPAAAKDLVTENVDYPVQMVKGRLKVRGGRYAEVPRNAGCVLSVDGERLAVYRDGRGKVQARSAVCTHMGCIVRWNPAETTWDCPCHGSRFDVDGSVIDGPAVKPLAPPQGERD